MLIARGQPRILLPLAPSFWREPSLAQPRDQFGRQNRTRFRIELWKRDGGLVDQRWFEDRDEFDYALYRELIEDSHPDLVPLWAATSFLTATSASNQTYTVPSDWNSSNNLIEVIASGASGGVRRGTNGGSGQVSRATGGGGGGYSAQPNVALTPDGSMMYRLPPGGVGVSAIASNTNFNGNDGADAWANGATLAGASVGAKGGLAGQTAGNTGAATSGGLGGDAAGGIGATKTSGGRGGDLSSTATSAARSSGGGGAGGPTSNGQNGEDSALANVATAGGDGGAPNGGVGSAAADGSNSSDGGAGTGLQTSPAFGSGGGSGGARMSGTSDVSSGNGGFYGAGSGAATTRNPSGNTGNATSGAGGQALIVITYTPGLASGNFLMMF